MELLENPPTLRPDGFAIRIAQPSTIVHAALRRCLWAGYELLELSKDGLLLGIGEGDYGLLCWARQPRPDRGLLIRNFVLAEVALNFVRLAIQIFSHAIPAPSQLQFGLRLENMTVDGHPCILSTGRDTNQPVFRERTAEAPDADIEVGYTAEFEGIEDGVVTYKLLAGLYVKFGFEYSDMPYVGDDGRRVTPESLLGPPTSR
jgi:hypothetical protein